MKKYTDEEFPLLQAAPLKKQEALFQIQFLLQKDALKEAASIVIAYNLDKASLESILNSEDYEKLSQTLEKYCG